MTALGLETEGLAATDLAAAAEEDLAGFAAWAGATVDLTTAGLALALATGLGAGLALDGAGAAGATFDLALTGTAFAGGFLEAAFASGAGLAGVFFFWTAATGLAALDAALAGAFLGVVTSCLLAV